MIWAFCMGAYTAGFAITLLVASAEWIEDHGAPDLLAGSGLLGAALLWPITIALVVIPAADD